MIFCFELNIKIKSFLMVFLLLSFFPFDLVADTEESENKIILAASLIKSGKINKALTVYNEIIDGDYKEDLKARALFFSASVYDSYLNQPDTALLMYDRAIKLYPDSKITPDALFNMAVLLYKTSKLKESIDFFSLYLKKYRGTIRFQSAKKWLDKIKFEYAKTSGKIVMSQDLKVLVDSSKKIVLVDADKEIIITDTSTGKILLVGDGPFAIVLKGDFFEINGDRKDIKLLTIESQDGIVFAGERKYRGKINLYNINDIIHVINIIPVEEYLYGVLPKEMPSEWSKQALMAQAIASRTYALYMKEVNAENHYDLLSDTNYQVYGGYEAESKKSNAAVDDTTGVVLSSSGSLISAFFHSDSGGYTESAENVWGTKQPCLESFKDGFSKRKKGNKWQLYLSYGELSRIFGINKSKNVIIKPIKMTKSGRLLKAIIKANKKSFNISGYNLRKTIGFKKLKSTLFKIRHKKNGIVFNGTGYGHGVGMSQWGASKMASLGYSFKDILKFYYKGCDFMLVSSANFR
ncbi:MAG: SpoIID/LytB domain-containing protein [Desulfobacterales bacterium]|nr:SpoIID/LytB domain-containing protein [Desulfobacterales bacterium]